MRAIKVHTFQKEKYTLVFGAFILGFTLLAGRLCYLMIFRSEELSKKALNIEQRERTIKAARGKIYDRNGIVLALSVLDVSVVSGFMPSTSTISSMQAFSNSTASPAFAWNETFGSSIVT